MPSVRVVMNYLKLYCKIVRNEEAKGLTKKQAKEQGLYVEGHHIFPRCIYGQNNDGNKRIIYVSSRVHYILHALLAKGFVKRYGKNNPKTMQMLLAHLRMKGYEYNKRYVNSTIYESLRKKYIDTVKGKPKSKDFCLKISNGKKGKNIKKDSHNTKPIKVYFEDGKVIEHLDGIKDFAISYGYSYCCISDMLNDKRKKYRDILKVEQIIKKDLPKNPKEYKPILSGKNCPHTLPIVIYFADGRTKICLDGAYNFCKSNSKYNATKLISVRKGERKRHMDIIKVEVYHPDMNITPIKKQYYKNCRTSIKITFIDGSSIIETEGFCEFCRKYPKYNRKTISNISAGKKSPYPEIVSVERLK